MPQNDFSLFKRSQVFRRSGESKGDDEKAGFGSVATETMKRTYG